jgi:hypothetical protein
MQQSPSWAVKWSSVSQEIPQILWNPKVHYSIHKHSLPLPVLSQSNQVHASPSHFLKIHFNIVLPSTSRSSKWSLSKISPHNNTVYTSPVPCIRCTPCWSHSSWFDCPDNLVRSREQKAPQQQQQKLAVAMALGKKEEPYVCRCWSVGL